MAGRRGVGACDSLTGSVCGAAEIDKLLKTTEALEKKLDQATEKLAHETALHDQLKLSFADREKACAQLALKVRACPPRLARVLAASHLPPLFPLFSRRVQLEHTDRRAAGSPSPTAGAKQSRFPAAKKAVDEGKGNAVAEADIDADAGAFRVAEHVADEIDQALAEVENKAQPQPPQGDAAAFDNLAGVDSVELDGENEDRQPPPPHLGGAADSESEGHALAGDAVAAGDAGAVGAAAAESFLDSLAGSLKTGEDGNPDAVGVDEKEAGDTDGDADGSLVGAAGETANGGDVNLAGGDEPAAADAGAEEAPAGDLDPVSFQ